MNGIFDESGSFNTDGLIMDRPSFQAIMADGVVSEEDINEQGERIKRLIAEMEPNFTPEQKAQIEDLVAEVSVLLTAAAIADQQE